MDEVLARGDKRCKHCKHPIRKIPYLLDDKWMHVEHASSFPTERNGGLWWACRTVVAEPEDE